MGAETSRDGSLRYIDCYPLPKGWGWAAEALDFRAPDTFIRAEPGGEPVVAPTVAQTKARDVVALMPGNNKEAPKASHDRTTPGAYPEAQQTANKGSKGRNPRGKCADFRNLGGEASLRVCQRVALGSASSRVAFRPEARRVCQRVALCN